MLDRDTRYGHPHPPAIGSDRFGVLVNCWAREYGLAEVTLRQLRKDLTVAILHGGMRASQRSSARTVELLLQVVLATVKGCLPLRNRLARNMKLTGLYRPGLVDEHFERAADQFRFLMHIFRAGFDESGTADHFHFDESFRYLEQAHALGRGVLHVAPHICCYPVYPRVVSTRIPCSIYLRRSPDPRKHEINKAIGQAGSGHLVYPPADAARGQRLAVAMRVLREGRMLFMTPDLPRKPSEGVPVNILGRKVYFPTGMIIMAMRTGAPIVPAMWHREDGVYRVRCFEPMTFDGRGDRRRRAAAGVRKFAELMDQFLRRHPDMWWNWLDKRWTAIIRNQSTT